MMDQRNRGEARRCLRSVTAFLIVGSLAGCTERTWAMRNLEGFEKAYDNSLVVWTTDLPPAMVGREYDFTLQARGQPKPFLWELVSGQLPNGMELDDDGEIQGTPTVSQVATFVVKVACKWPARSSALGSSPHVGWRMRQFTLVVKNLDLASPPRATKSDTAVRP